MKRRLLIFLILAAGLWLLAGPWAVGAYLRVWAPEWIAEWTAAGAHQFESGWFQSRLDAQWPDGSRLELAGRHLPPGRPGWLALAGNFHPPAPAGPVRIDGHFGMLGTLEVTAASPRVSLNEAIEVDARQPGLRFLQQTSGAFRLDGRLARVDLGDLHANRLRLGTSRLQINWQLQSGDRARLELELETRRTGQDPSRLELVLDQVDRQALADLLAAFEQFLQAGPESFEQRMAGLAMAGAWQELAAAGLELRLNRLELDGRARFSGRWHPASGAPEIIGDGHTETLLDWLQPIIGLARGIVPDDAEREARAWLKSLADYRWLHTDQETFRFEYRGTGAGGDRDVPTLPTIALAAVDWLRVTASQGNSFEQALYSLRER